MHVCGIEKNGTDECICRAEIEMQTEYKCEHQEVKGEEVWDEL